MAPAARVHYHYSTPGAPGIASSQSPDVKSGETGAKEMTKRIGLSTSGGDCGGLNAVIRGGQPTAGDRLLASTFGVYAVDLVAAGRFDCKVAWQNRRVVDVPLAVAIAMPHCVDPDGALVRTASGLGICLGDG